ncbi:MAG: serine/threonine protein kinase [Alphaproteobacteria bacterium]|nr:serine/threonine protein kinase [Alphaproteobacteria bacterium]
MSIIWEGVEATSGASIPRRVAIKTLTAEASELAERHAALQHEAELLSSLRHPHIVAFVDRGALPEDAPAPFAPGAPWTATELARGGPLNGLAGRLPWDRVRRLLQQLLSALVYLHGEGVLHLDLKPSNVLLAGPDHLRLCDFGLAQPLWMADAAPLDWGTPAYMAPEQLREPRGRLTERTDLYSFGCVAWTLITGRPPFGRSADEATVQHLYGAMPCLDAPIDLPPGAEGWLRGLLARSPHQRTESAEAALEGLMGLGEAQAEGARAQSWFLSPHEAPGATVTTRRVARG